MLGEYRIKWNEQARLLLLILAKEVEEDSRTEWHRLRGAKREQKWREVAKRFPRVFDAVSEDRGWSICYFQFKDLQRKLQTMAWPSERDPVMTEQVCKKLREYLAILKNKSGMLIRTLTSRSASDDKIIRECVRFLVKKNWIPTHPYRGKKTSRFRWTERSRLCVIRAVKASNQGGIQTVAGFGNWIEVAKSLPVSVFGEMDLAQLEHLARTQFNIVFRQYRSMKSSRGKSIKTSVLTLNICRELEEIEDILLQRKHTSKPSGLNVSSGSDYLEREEFSSGSEFKDSSHLSGNSDDCLEETKDSRDALKEPSTEYFQENRTPTTARKRKSSSSHSEPRSERNNDIKNEINKDDEGFDGHQIISESDDEPGVGPRSDGHRDNPHRSVKNAETSHMSGDKDGGKQHYNCQTNWNRGSFRSFDLEFSRLSKWINRQLLPKGREIGAQAICSNIPRSRTTSGTGCEPRTDKRLLEKTRRKIMPEFQQVREHIREDLEKTIESIFQDVEQSFPK